MLLGGVNKSITLNLRELTHNLKCVGQNPKPGLMFVLFSFCLLIGFTLQKGGKPYLVEA